MLKTIGKILGLGLLGLAIVFTTVAVIKGTSNQYSVELANKNDKDEDVEVDEKGVGVVLLKSSEKGEN